MSALGRLVVIHRLPGRTLALALTGSLLLPLSAGARLLRPQLAVGAPAVAEVAVQPAPHGRTGVGPETAARATAGPAEVAGMLAALALLVASANLAGMFLADTVRGRSTRPRRTAPGALARPGGP